MTEQEQREEYEILRAEEHLREKHEEDAAQLLDKWIANQDNEPTDEEITEMEAHFESEVEKQIQAELEQTVEQIRSESMDD